MKPFIALSLIVVATALTAATSRADDALLSPRAQQLRNSTVATATQDQIDRSSPGYTGRTPFDRTEVKQVATKAECKTAGGDCTMKCCSPDENARSYTGRTAGLTVASTVKAGCKVTGSNCTMACCK